MVAGPTASGLSFKTTRGTNALGFGSAGLAYCNITSSVAVLLNVYAALELG